MNSQLTGSQHTDEKRALVRRVLESHPQSAEAFLPLLADDDPFMRQSTIEAMMTRRTLDIAPFIATLINDPDSMVRVDAIEAIGVLRYVPASSDLLERRRQDTNGLVRICAAEALGELDVQDDPTIAALIAAMEADHNELVRAYAAESLGRLRTTSARARIQAQLGVDRSSRARASMLLALYHLGDPVALARLLRMLRRVRRWEMEAAILNMLREIVAPHDRIEIERALLKIAKSKPDFVAVHPFDMDLLHGGDASPQPASS